MTAPRTRVVHTAAAVLTAALGLAACTSSSPSDGDTPSTSASGSTSVPSTAAPSTSAAPRGLAPVDGAYLLVGRTQDSADVYRVRSGALLRLSVDRHVTTVTADDGTVVVGREQGGNEIVQRLRAEKLSSLGIAGFSPALSDDGALAWVSLDGPGSTPGVSKPRGFTVHVRSSLTGRDRDLATFPNSVGGLRWTDDGLVAAVAAGDRARLVRIPTGGGAPRTIATVADGDDLDVSAGDDDRFTVSSGDGAVVVSGTTQRPFVTGWRPLCWSDDDEVLAAKAGRLATVAIDGSGRPGVPRVLGSLPPGTSAFGGSCGD